jgi:PPK2 family polyphosphate:nucleotide phosphotransferase
VEQASAGCNKRLRSRVDKVDDVLAKPTTLSMVKAIDHADLLAKPGRTIHLAAFDPAFTCDFRSKSDAQAKLHADIERLSALQDMFYAQGRHALLIIFQGMDAAGKDGSIKHVMSGVNPQGVHVYSFRTPSPEELAHDYLWRSTKVLPERGRIAIFNRSYYEELGVVRVHASLLESEQLPPAATDSHLWRDRYNDIAAFEEHLSRNGTLILKFFLNLSKGEQRKRLLERIDTPDKNWKISVTDVRERTFWDSYQHAYEKMLTHTSTEIAPWYIIPADHKWFTRAAVADVVVARLESLELTYPQVGDEQRALLLAEREQLANDDEGRSQPHELTSS